ncbi:MAG TPA: hypothetical protein VGU72_18260 [Beijerinckiaceae bacterium]|jgi:hypothetical protein|nr:hypothetical protein [Beijerinckiaceae bacterium]
MGTARRREGRIAARFFRRLAFAGDVKIAIAQRLISIAELLIQATVHNGLIRKGYLICVDGNPFARLVA